MDLLDVSLKEIGKRGREYADAERAYRTELATEILGFRAEGMPVTITPDLARGKENVADLRLDRDCKEAMYKAALESVNVYKLQLKILENQYSREWGNIK